MVTIEEARRVRDLVSQMPQFQKPVVNVIGITKKNGELAVVVNFVTDPPNGVKLPEQIDGVEIVYRFNTGKIIAR